jgi:hypothetical protein
MAGTKVLTRNITAGNTFLINHDMGVLACSFQMSTGASDAGTYSGDAVQTDSNGAQLSSQAIPLGPGMGQTLSGTPSKPLDGITLACTSGTMYLTLYY